MNQKKIIDAIADHLGVSNNDIEKQALLREDLGLGPVEIAELMNFLQQKFDIVIEPEEISEIQTVDDLIAIIEDNSI